MQNEPEPAPDRRREYAKRAKRAAIAGAVLALVCPLLPEHWQHVCHALVSLLTP